MITIYTVQHNHVRLAHQHNVPVVDITVMSGNPAFAPTWELLRAYKAGIVDAEEYTRQFKALMDESWHANRSDWDWLLSQPTVALACYCRPGDFCHRHLIKERLIDLHSQAGEEAIDGGELTPYGE